MRWKFWHSLLEYQLEITFELLNKKNIEMKIIFIRVIFLIVTTDSRRPSAISDIILEIFFRRNVETCLIVKFMKILKTLSFQRKKNFFKIRAIKNLLIFDRQYNTFYNALILKKS
jgi:hypothetical protein